MTQFTAFTGDHLVLTVPLVKAGASYTPGGSSAFIFTVKNSRSDPDTAAVIQKASGAGITISGSNALIALVREDTEELTVPNVLGRRFVFDVLELIDGVSEFPVAEGDFLLKQRITREQQTSIPVITTSDPLPFGGGAQLTETGTGSLVLTVNGTAYYLVPFTTDPNA